MNPHPVISQQDHEKEHLSYLNLILNHLRANGIVSKQSIYPADVILFFSQHMNKVTNAIVLNDEGVFNAFTTGDIALNDNFDKPPYGVPVENCVFGPVKYLLEKYCWDHTPGADPNELLEKLDAVDNDILKISAKKKLAHQPIVQLCESRKQYVQHLKSSLQIAKPPQEIVASYFQLRDAFLPYLVNCDPRIAKMAVGRNTIYSVMGTTWNSVCDAAVFFTRRSMLAHNPNIAFLFCLLHKFGPACEISKDDNIWAYKLVPTVESMGPLDYLLKTGSSDPTLWGCAQDPDLQDIFTNYMDKKLGNVNNLVAASLTRHPIEEETVFKFHNAQILLTACGWRDWCSNYVYKGEDIFNPPPLPDNMLRFLERSTARDAKMALNFLNDQLKSE